MTPEERQAALENLAAEVRSCTRCPLHAQRTQAVPGHGHPETEVVFVGEGPGFNEDREGLPFVGAAGGLLNQLLGAIGWRREDVFVTNVVKCRPPGNRDPEPAEIAACAPFLRRQLEVLDPALVVTLGRHSLQTFMPAARIGAAHGTFRPVDPASGAAGALAYAMYHPAAALRQNALRRTMLEDTAGIPEALIRSRERRSQASSPEAGQPAEAAPGREQPAEVTPEGGPPAQATADTAQSAGASATAGTSLLPIAQPGSAPLPVAAAGPADDDQMELFR